MDDIGAVRVHLDVDYYETRAIRSALRQRLKKAERDLARNPFTPEPGRINVNEAYAGLLRGVLERLELQLTAALEAAKKEERHG